MPRQRRSPKNLRGQRKSLGLTVNDFDKWIEVGILKMTQGWNTRCRFLRQPPFCRFFHSFYPSLSSPGSNPCHGMALRLLPTDFTEGSSLPIRYP
jgi:hypothetical protein